MIRVSDSMPLVSRRRSRRRVGVWLGSALVLLGICVSCSTSGGVIDRLTIVNRTEFDVEVQASDAKKESWQILGQAKRRSSKVSESVTDEGRTWVFQFHYGGKLVGELTVDREQLDRDQWRVEVPQSVARTMRHMGFEPRPDP